MLLRLQKFVPTTKLVLQGADAPGANDASRRTTPPRVRSSVTVTLVRVMLPQLATTPVKLTEEEEFPHRKMSLGLQNFVTLMHGVVTFEQVALHWLVTFEPIMSVPVTMIKSVVGAHADPM